VSHSRCSDPVIVILPTRKLTRLRSIRDALFPKLVVTTNFLRLQRSPPKWERYFRPQSRKLKSFQKSLQCDEDARRGQFHSKIRQSQVLRLSVASLTIHSRLLTEVKRRLTIRMSSHPGFQRSINSQFCTRKGANSTSSRPLWRRSLTPMIFRKGLPMLWQMRSLPDIHLLQAWHPRNQQGTSSQTLHRRGNIKRRRHQNLLDSKPRSTNRFPKGLPWCPLAL